MGGANKNVLILLRSYVYYLWENYLQNKFFFYKLEWVNSQWVFSFITSINIDIFYSDDTRTYLLNPNYKYKSLQFGIKGTRCSYFLYYVSGVFQQPAVSPQGQPECIIYWTHGQFRWFIYNHKLVYLVKRIRHRVPTSGLRPLLMYTQTGLYAPLPHMNRWVLL